VPGPKDTNGTEERKARERALSDAYSHLDTARQAVSDLESRDQERARAAAALVQKWNGGERAERSAAERTMVRYLKAMRGVLRTFERKGLDGRQTAEDRAALARGLERRVLRDVRDPRFRECFDGAFGLAPWTDADIRTALRATHFNVTVTRLMTEHGYPMTEKNVEKLLGSGKRQTRKSK
jgi:hypothetical protein